MYVQYSYAENDFLNRLKLIEKAKMNYESKGMQQFTFGVQVDKYPIVYLFVFLFFNLFKLYLLIYFVLLNYHFLCIFTQVYAMLVFL